MNDLDRLIEKENLKNPGFRDNMKIRSTEVEIALKLRAARETLKLSQKEIALRYNISLRAISRIENPKDNHISLYLLKWYANILGFDLKLELISH